MRAIPIEDWDLVERVKAGQTEAFSTLVLKYQDRVFNTCWRICGHLEDARDVTQEAFLKAFENLAGFRHQSGFYTWIFRVAVNLSLTHRRSAKRRRMASLDEQAESGGLQATELRRLAQAGSSDGPLEDSGGEDVQANVVQALNALDDDHRAVVVLRDMEGFDYQEIAEILGIPTGTVKSRLHRGRMAIREAIVPYIRSVNG